MRIAFYTLGCKTNQAETAALIRIAEERGHRIVPFAEEADVYIVNSCSVTGTAGVKSRAAVRQARRRAPDAVVAVAGCQSQLFPDEMEEAGANLVFGTTRRRALLDAALALAERWAAVGRTPAEDAPEGNIQNEIAPVPPRLTDEAQFASGSGDRPGSGRYEPLPAGGLGDRTRALLKVEDGCDNFCAYCIIPYARGRVRSAAIAEAVAEARRLAGEGYRETVLTGIELSSFGKDTGERLVDLVEALLRATPDMRYRLGSLEPRTVDDAFCQKLSAYPNLCPHFHLSLQSGCDKTLRAMGRKYDGERFFQAATALRSVFPDCGITADLIVGFPGETEGDFEESLAFARRCAFSGLHVFPYSRRAGTAAARRPDQVPRAEKERRAALAGAAAGEMRQDFLRTMVGKRLEVLFEREEDGCWLGHSSNYCLVSAASGTPLKNRLERVKIAGLSGDVLLAET